MRLAKLGLVVALGALTSCAFGPQESGRLTDSTEVRVTVLDERGDPIEGAAVSLDQVGERATDQDGHVSFRLSQPDAGVVTAAGTLPEPIAIGPRDTDFTVKLFDRRSADGAVRRALHFGGDVMLGRRYQDSDRVETPLVRNDSSARKVGSSLASISSVADATIVNLETVVGDLPAELAYPGKRFLLQSPPATLALLEALGVDLVTLGNNHAADWRDAGVTSTLAALDDAEMPHVGAGMTAADAIAPAGDRRRRAVGRSGLTDDRQRRLRQRSAPPFG